MTLSSLLDSSLMMDHVLSLEPSSTKTNLESLEMSSSSTKLLNASEIALKELGKHASSL